MELIYILRCKITNNFSYMQIYSAFFSQKDTKFTKWAQWRLYGIL